jgi:proline iminopeptidase
MKRFPHTTLAGTRLTYRTAACLALLTVSVAGCTRRPDTADTSAARAADLPPTDSLPRGEHRLAVSGGTIWYKATGSGPGLPVVLLHGGPGFSSFYLKPFEALGSERLVIRYDQLGSGKSDKTSDTAMFNIAHFVADLDSLRSALHLDKVHLVGHSWGTILAIEYHRAHPEYVASLTLAGGALDMPTWQKNARRLVGTLSDSAQRAIRAREADGNFQAPDYEAAVGEYFGKFVWRRPAEADLDSTLKTVNEMIYDYMWGPSEFTITGTLKEYNAVPLLTDVKVPVLFTVGEFDEADPATIKRQAEMSPGAKYAVIPGAAHITTWDNPEEQIRVVREFLRAADSSVVKP